MVTHAPRVLSYAFLTTFILSECHHRSFLYLKKALTDILFQSKSSIGRFSVHRWCVILASNSDLRTKKTIYTIEKTSFRAQSFRIRKTRINKTRLQSCLCPKLYYTDDNTHTVIKVIENTRICPLYRSTEGITCTFHSHPVNSVDPDQTAPTGAVCSGSTLYASVLNLLVMLGNYLQQTTSADSIFRCIFFLAL